MTPFLSQLSHPELKDLLKGANLHVIYKSQIIGVWLKKEKER